MAISWEYNGLYHPPNQDPEHTPILVKTHIHSSSTPYLAGSMSIEGMACVYVSIIVYVYVYVHVYVYIYIYLPIYLILSNLI